MFLLSVYVKSASINDKGSCVYDKLSTCYYCERVLKDWSTFATSIPQMSRGHQSHQFSHKK